MLRSGLIIEVSAAEDAVGCWRRQFDPQALLGVPPHVTVLYPFAPPDRIDDVLVSKLESLLSPIHPFDFQLVGTNWFGDHDVLWLAPEPAESIRHLTKTLAVAFPEYPPYGGEFDGTTPHLTVAPQGTPEELHRAEHDIQPHLPIPVAARAVTLMVERPDNRWQQREIFQLAGRS